jgi:hypothetical protein
LSFKLAVSITKLFSAKAFSVGSLETFAITKTYEQYLSSICKNRQTDN